MGYDLHIVRTNDWFSSESNPITIEDANKLIEMDPELSWSTSDYIDMKGKDGQVTRYYMICWNGESVFWWHESEIRCKNPNGRQGVKFVKMATLLNAKVLGDEGEQYIIETGTDGSEKIKLIK